MRSNRHWTRKRGKTLEGGHSMSRGQPPRKHNSA